MHPFATIFCFFALATSAVAQTTEVTQFQASDPDSDDQYGFSVAVSGHTAVMGAPQDEDRAFFAGSAYVQFQEDGLWVQQAKLIGSTTGTSDRFGYDVDIFGDTIVVSALFADGASPVSGTAFVFQRNGTTWTEIQELAPNDGANGDWFGRAVSLDGDTLAIGAPQDDDRGLNSGSVYVFVRSGGTWVQQAKIAPADGFAHDNFGQSVAVSGDSLLIGSPFDDDRGSSSGSAYVFTRSGSNWTQQAKLTGTDSTSQDAFGYAVGLAGDRAIVGAYNANVGIFGVEAGAAFIYDRQAGVWSAGQKIIPAARADRDFFGWSVAVEGDDAIVAANGRNRAQGGAFHFRKLGGVWTENQELVASDAANSAQFAVSVDMDGERVVAGSHLNSTAAYLAGAAYEFDLFRLDLVPDQPTAGQVVSFEVSGGLANAQTWLAYSRQGSGIFPIAALGVTLELQAPSAFGSAKVASADGAADWPFIVPISASGATIWLQGLQAGHVTNLKRVTIL